MSTSHLSDRRSALDRGVAYVLDFDGDMYGRDGRERIRWYEGIALTSTVQTLAVLWVMAIAVWMVGAEAARALAVVGVAFVVPMSIQVLYAELRGIDTRVVRFSGKRITWMVASGAPIAIFVAGFQHTASIDSTFAWAAAAGAAVAVASAVVGMIVRLRGEASGR